MGVMCLILSHILPPKHRQEYGPHEEAEDCLEQKEIWVVLWMLIIKKERKRKEEKEFYPS